MAVVIVGLWIAVMSALVVGIALPLVVATVGLAMLSAAVLTTSTKIRKTFIDSLLSSLPRNSSLQTPHFPPCFAQCLQWWLFLQTWHGPTSLVMKIWPCIVRRVRL